MFSSRRFSPYSSVPWENTSILFIPSSSSIVLRIHSANGLLQALPVQTKQTVYFCFMIILVMWLFFYFQSGNFVLAVFAYMPSVTPCTFIDRKMYSVFLSHCFRSLFCNMLWWICHLGLAAPSGNMAVFAEYAKSIVRDENVSPCALSRQLIPYSQHNVFCIHSLSFYLVMIIGREK